MEQEIINVVKNESIKYRTKLSKLFNCLAYINLYGFIILGVIFCFIGDYDFVFKPWYLIGFTLIGVTSFATNKLLSLIVIIANKYLSKE